MKGLQERLRAATRGAGSWRSVRRKAGRQVLARRFLARRRPALILASALALGLGGALAAETSRAQALRELKGARVPDISVPVNRALTLESQAPFAQISVANPAIAGVAALSNRRVYVLGKPPGRTTLTGLGPEGRLIANIAVQVGPDLAEFKARLRQILPGEAIEVRSAADGLVLSGAVRSSQGLSRAPDLAERDAPGRVSNMLNVARIRLAEVQRNAAKELGFDWGFNWGFGFRSGAFFRGRETGGFLKNDNRPGSGGYVASDGMEGLGILGFATSSILAELTTEAMEAKGFAGALAEPNLTALSGSTAGFPAGGEYPAPAATGDDGRLTAPYRPSGVSLAFTPTVVGGDLINLDMTAESSAIDTSVLIEGDGIEYNGVSTRRANAPIELYDGQSFAIAGLLQDEFADNARQVPWLGDVPILGALFRSSGFQRRRTERVVVLTACLVIRSQAEDISLPAERVRPPSESELFLMGELEAARDPALRAAGAHDLEGACGHVLEQVAPGACGVPRVFGLRGQDRGQAVRQRLSRPCQRRQHRRGARFAGSGAGAASGGALGRFRRAGADPGDLRLRFR